MLLPEETTKRSHRREVGEQTNFFYTCSEKKDEEGEGEGEGGQL